MVNIAVNIGYLLLRLLSTFRRMLFHKVFWNSDDCMKWHINNDEINLVCIVIAISVGPQMGVTQ